METNKYLYESVVFCQGDDPTEPLDILDDQGHEAVIDYLKQWHDPGRHDTHTQPCYGQEDRTYEHEGYVLSWNHRLGYIGLEYRLNQDD